MLDGFQVSGVCRPSADALQAWKSSLPLVYPSGAGYHALTVSSATIDSNGLIAFSLQDETGATVLTNGQQQLNPCDSSLIQSVTSDSVSIVTGMVLFMVIGYYLGSWIISQKGRA